MSDSLDAEAIKTNNIEKMGIELGEVYSELWQQLTWLYHKWGEYVALFGTNEDRIKLLNATAPSFSHTIQTCLWEDILLHLARMTDAPKSAGKDNLTFKRLNIASNKNNQQNDKLEALLEIAINNASFARDWRNRRIAHRDLMLALKKPAEPLAEASRKHVNDALSALGDVLNFISLQYLESTTIFEFASEPSAGGASSMLFYLNTGHRAEMARMERVKSGFFNPEDFKRLNI